MGSDAGPYLDWMKKNQINTDYIKVIKDKYTAQAYITTDKSSNQITTFHPGAMQHANEIKIPDNGLHYIGNNFSRWKRWHDRAYTAVN